MSLGLFKSCALTLMLAVTFAVLSSAARGQDSVSQTCAQLGFKPGTKGHTDCVNQNSGAGARIAPKPANPAPATKAPIVPELTLSGGALEQGKKLSRVVEGLKKKGVTACATELDSAVKFVHEDDSSYGFTYVWSEKDANKRSAVVVTSQRFGGSSSMISNFISTPDASGSCSVAVTQNFVFKRSCTAIREDTFKGWKFYGDLGATTAYDAPDSDSESLKAFLTATEDGGCHVLRRIVYYY